MPKLNAYTDDPGYFIRAWGSDIGNVTYQIKPMGEKVLTDAGYRHGDDLPWSVVNALRAAKLVETGSDQPDKYADKSDNFEPNQGIVEIDSRKAAEIFELLKTETGVDGERLNRARGVLGVESQSTDPTDTEDTTDSYAEKITRRVEAEIDSSTEYNSPLFNPEHESDIFAPEIEHKSPGEYVAKLGFSLITDGGTEQVGQGIGFLKVSHELDDGMIEIEVTIDPWKSYDDAGGFEQAWEARAEINELLGVVLPIMESVLKEEGYIVGSATGDVSTSIRHL